MRLLSISTRFLLGLVFLTLLTGAAMSPGVVKTEEHDLRFVEITSDLEHPWGLAFLPDGRMMVTERPGRLRIITEGRLSTQSVSGLPEIAANGQGGLLDVAIHPNFTKNNLVYLSYTASGAGSIGTEVLRGKLQGNQLKDVETIFRMQPKSKGSRHFGSRLVFDREGYLYITLGDRGDRPRAQKPEDHAGSVIRLHDDGRIPSDNPFVGKQGWKAEKYTLGHRNMQGAALHPRTGQLWTQEHGPQGGDEVNVIRPGINYGWPVITYGVNYGFGTKIGEGTHKEGMAQPVHYWVPSIAPSGMAFYSGSKFPKWNGNLFVGALKDQMLVRLVLDGEQVVYEERLLKNRFGRIRDVRQGPDGHLYLLTDENNGMLIRIEPAN